MPLLGRFIHMSTFVWESVPTICQAWASGAPRHGVSLPGATGRTCTGRKGPPRAKIVSASVWNYRFRRFRLTVLIRPFPCTILDRRRMVSAVVCVSHIRPSVLWPASKMHGSVVPMAKSKICVIYGFGPVPSWVYCCGLIHIWGFLVRSGQYFQLQIKHKHCNYWSEEDVWKVLTQVPQR